MTRPTLRHRLALRVGIRLQAWVLRRAGVDTSGMVRAADDYAKAARG